MAAKDPRSKTDCLDHIQRQGHSTSISKGTYHSWPSLLPISQHSNFFFFFFVILENLTCPKVREMNPPQSSLCGNASWPLIRNNGWERGQNQPTSPNAISWVCFCLGFSPWLFPKDPHFSCLLTAGFPCFSLELLLNPTGLSPWILQSWSLAGLT